MKTLFALLRIVFIATGLIGVAMGGLVLLVIGWASGGGSGAGMIAYAATLFVPPVAATLIGVGFIGVLVTGIVARRYTER